MQCVLIIHCFICKVSLLFTALYAKCPYYLLYYMQRVLIIYCLICKVSLLLTALYTKCPYYPLPYMQSALIIHCLICKVSLLFTALEFKSELTDSGHNFSDPVGVQNILCWVGFGIQPHDGLLNIRRCTNIKYGV